MLSLRNLYEDIPDELGAYGEMIVNSLVRLKSFKERECYLIKDVYIEDDRGVHQIDHIFILTNGVFIVETKTYYGKVFGESDAYLWYSKGYQFYNPILQNASHVKALEQLFGNKFKFISLVVFPKENKPKNMPDNVINFSKMKSLNTFSSFGMFKSVILSISSDFRIVGKSAKAFEKCEF